MGRKEGIREHGTEKQNFFHKTYNKREILLDNIHLLPPGRLPASAPSPGAFILKFSEAGLGGPVTRDGGLNFENTRRKLARKGTCVTSLVIWDLVGEENFLIFFRGEERHKPGESSRTTSPGTFQLNFAWVEKFTPAHSFPRTSLIGVYSNLWTGRG